MGLGAAVERKAEPHNERLGGARADFVANLGRRVAEIATTLKHLTAEPESSRIRDELRRRVHALGAGARLLRFAGLAEELGGCEDLLQQIAERGRLEPGDIAVLRGMFERMPALAWGQVAATGPVSGSNVVPPPAPTLPGLGMHRPLSPRPSSAAAAALALETAETTPARWPQSALVVGPAALADALTDDIAEGAKAAFEDEPSPFEVERTEDVATAIDLARALAPDILIIDTEAPGARDLVEALVSDPLTEPVPIVVVGRWSRPDEAAPFVALGVARALPKPVSPAVLRRACSEATATHGRRDAVREALGSMTLDELGTRLADELRRGLCDAADAKGRNARVELGEGSEVLAALWGAVARIRDVVTIQSSGAVRFSPTGPEGALPMAAWIGSNDAAPGEARALAATDARVAGAAKLNGIGILVADDDPAVTWFLAGVLRAAGAEVHEAHDGTRALEVAHRVAPDLVISDVVMPGLDGFALCRALKRDLVLRDVPVILLSWKEDLLQRVRELGADADGYLRKEASAASIVQRVREVLRPRRRVAERLAGGGEARGRLDGLTTRTLLGLACVHRPWSILTVRDASFLYEVEIQDGKPVRATRTATDGTFQRGPSVMAALLGVGAGRFVLTPATEDGASRPGRNDLTGRLSEQLYPPIAEARAAQRLLSGASLMQVERVVIAEDRITAYIAATPEPARTLLRRLAGGASPRVVITSGQASARLVEDVLCDAAAHGAVTGVFGAGDLDLFTPAAEREMAVLSGVRLSLAPAAMPDPLEEINTLPAITAMPLDLAPTTAEEPVPASDSTPAEPAPNSIPPGMEDAEGLWPFRRSLVGFGDTPPAVQEPPLATPPPPGGEPSAAHADTPLPVPEKAQTPSPAMAALAAPIVQPPAQPAPARVPPPLTTLGSLTPPPVHVPAPPARPEPPPPAPAMPPAPPPPPPAPAMPPAPPPVARPIESEPPPRAVPRPSAYAPSPVPRPAPDRRSTIVWIGFAVAACGFAVAMRWTHQPPVQPPPPLPAALAQPAPAPTDAPAAAPTATEEPKETDPTGAVSAQELALRPEDKVGPGQGMLEIIAGAGDTIYVDGRLIGTGPLAKLALPPKGKPYEVRVTHRGEERVRFVAMKQGRLLRVRLAPPWAR